MCSNPRVSVSNLFYLIKLLQLFPAYFIYTPFVTLSMFVALSNFRRLINLLSSSHPLLSVHFFTLSTNLLNVPSQHITHTTLSPVLSCARSLRQYTFPNSIGVMGRRATLMWGDRGMAGCFSPRRKWCFKCMPNIILVSAYDALTTIEICPSSARYIRLTSFNEWFSAVGLQADFLRVWGTIWKDWSRLVLATGEIKKGHFWMQRITETVGEFLKGDWGRSRLITGGNISGHYCIFSLGLGAATVAACSTKVGTESPVYAFQAELASFWEALMESAFSPQGKRDNK